MKRRVQFEGQTYSLEKGKIATVRINADRDEPRFEVRVLSAGKARRFFFPFHNLQGANDLARTRNEEGMDYGKVFRILPSEREALSAYRIYERERNHAGMPCRSLFEILTESIAREKDRDASSSFSVAADSYIEEQSKQAGEAHAATTRLRVERLKAVFGTQNMASITADDVKRAIEGMTYRGKPLSKTTRNQFVNLVSAIFSHAISNGCDVRNPTDGIMRHKIEAERPGIVTPHEARLILNYYSKREPEHLASVVIGLFAGVRAEERLKLRRRDIHLDDSQPYVRIDATISKTWARDSYLPPCAIEWLQLCLPVYQTQEDFISPGADLKSRKERSVRSLARCESAIGFDIPKNAFRHSASSYKCAMEESMAAAALQLGHSESVMRKHYRALVSRKDAEMYFNLFPVAIIKAASYSA